MIELLCDKWSHTPLEQFSQVFGILARGETEIYGKVITMQTLNSLFVEQAEAEARNLEREHERQRLSRT